MRTLVPEPSARFRDVLRSLGRALVGLLAIYGYAVSGYPMPHAGYRDPAHFAEKAGNKAR